MYRTEQLLEALHFLLIRESVLPSVNRIAQSAARQGKRHKPLLSVLCGCSQILSQERIGQLEASQKSQGQKFQIFGNGTITGYPNILVAGQLGMESLEICHHVRHE